MSEIRLLLKLTRVVTTPKDAALLLGVAAVIIALAYIIPADIADYA